MENNKTNSENSQNQGPKTGDNKAQENKPQRNRRPNPHRQNRTESSQGENRQGNNPNRKPNQNRKPNPNRQQNASEGQGNNQNRRPNPNQKNNQNRKPNNGQNKNSNQNKNRNKRKNVTTVNDAMRASMEENRRVQEARMAPWKQIDINSKGKVRFTPLGGLGEIGGNMAVLETESTAIVIDVGMSFPDETMHGVDILVPDFSYLHAIKDKIKAIVITHGHEDHIGAMPYLFKELKFPVYGTPLALAMIENKFNEHGLKADAKYFNFVTKRKQYTIGDMKIEWMHNTHSIIDACSLAIETPAGTLIHTADFKVDHTPVDGYTMDLQRYAYYGSKGVLCLFSDSTNSHNPGFTKSETVVGKTFDSLFEMAKGRVIMSTFSSNVHRIFQAMERGVKHGRKICVIGRSMERNVETNRALGFVDIEDKHFIEVHEVPKYADHEVLIVTTGSQGETMAALNRMATDEHRHIKLKPSDTVIISASAIPGNEASVSKLMNLLVKAGVTVRYREFSDIHVSGHAAQEEQKLILRLVQPKFFLPVHGEYNHIAKHAKTAVSCGVDERNILLMSDGDQVEITPKYLKKVKTVKSGKTYIDNQNNMTIENDVVLDRQKLAEDGIVTIVAQIAQSNGKMVGKPVVYTHGLVPDKEDKKFAKEIELLLETMLLNMKGEGLKDHIHVENEIRNAVRKHVIRSKKRYPLIIPTVFIV
ncbi:ribonuclease J [Sulfurovum lithotrophicum]|uniref:Ribonuclease J n=1 Tax=Sulfurovum lithotrophicum TaxID=206403 RepID=A0A7U4RRE5_9BACT|nr:ribonuclease J [Sulfurovum lithotrophicum]AKF25828.1 ribonuclease J [Sulfurovum lithotrophicum]